MGSFAYTCAVSGLPIECGDRVRYFLLTKNPYHNGAENTCSIHDLWFPRTFPLCGIYNDYGSVEEIAVNAEQEVWLEGFEKDMIEQGWGENTIHDVSTKKNMKFNELLNAIQEGRILVQREVEHISTNELWENIKSLANKALGKKEDTRSPEEKRDSKVPAGIPTMFRIQKIAEKLGIPIYDGNWNKTSIVIDEPTRGEVRIRCHNMYGEDLKPDDKFTPGKAVEHQVRVLEKLQAELSNYATMISTGSGGCAVSKDKKRTKATYIQPDTELLIRPKPGTHDGAIYKYRNNKQPLPVGHAMIREDVWQALIKLSFEGYTNSSFKNIKIQTYYDGIFGFLDGIKQKSKNIESLDKKTADLLSWVEKDILIRDHQGAWIFKDSIPFTVGLGTHFDLLINKGDLAKETANMMAEFAFIHHILSSCRYQWRPSSSAGPQFGEYRSHKKLHTAFAKIANDILIQNKKNE